MTNQYVYKVTVTKTPPMEQREVWRNTLREHYGQLIPERTHYTSLVPKDWHPTDHYVREFGTTDYIAPPTNEIFTNFTQAENRMKQLAHIGYGANLTRSEPITWADNT